MNKVQAGAKILRLVGYHVTYILPNLLNIFNLHFAELAQLVEQLIRNE